MYFAARCDEYKDRYKATPSMQTKCTKRKTQCTAVLPVQKGGDLVVV